MTIHWRRGASSGHDSAPSAVQTMNAGIARSSTASNRPATSAPVIVASNAARSRPSFDLRKNRARNASARSAAAIGPRSETAAIQSLLGHGLNVMPGSESFIEGSLFGANASHAARERVRTSDAMVIAAPIDQSQ